MNSCVRFQQMMIDCIERQIKETVCEGLLEHTKMCSACAREYRQIQNLLGILAEDRVSLPPQESFDRIEAKVRQKVFKPKVSMVKRVGRILIPTLAIAAVLFILLKPRSHTVDMSIPVANLIEDEEIARIAVAGIIDRALIDEIVSMEEHLSFDNEEVIEEMTYEEKCALVNYLNRKYAIGT
jgi:predicted anti-sigma-YlaC factor YlaD